MTSPEKTLNKQEIAKEIPKSPEGVEKSFEQTSKDINKIAENISGDFSAQDINVENANNTVKLDASEVGALKQESEVEEQISAVNEEAEKAKAEFNKEINSLGQDQESDAKYEELYWEGEENMTEEEMEKFKKETENNPGYQAWATNFLKKKDISDKEEVPKREVQEETDKKALEAQAIEEVDKAKKVQEQENEDIEELKLETRSSMEEDLSMAFKELKIAEDKFIKAEQIMKDTQSYLNSRNRSESNDRIRFLESIDEKLIKAKEEFEKASKELSEKTIQRNKIYNKDYSK